MTSSASIIPPWITAPAGFVMLILVLHHAARTWHSAEPLSRRRIRLANAAVMSLTLPLLTIGFSFLDHRAQPRAWTLVWLCAMTLLAVNIALAVLDVANTLRMVRRARRALRAALAALSTETDALRAPLHAPAPPPDFEKGAERGH